jgi:hypothetical protein
MQRFALLAVLALVMAGCSSPPDIVTEKTTCVDNPLPNDEAHDHGDPAQHQYACNATLIAHASLREFGWSEEVPVGAHALAIHEHLLAVAVNSGEGGTGQQGFHLFDVSDPADPIHRSFWNAGVPVNGDRTIAFSPDGKTVFLGFESDPRPGVAAVDVTDPTAPVEVAFWSDPTGYGPHTLSAGDIGGVTYVFSLALGVAILRYDGAFTMESRFVTADELAILDAARLADPGNPNTYPLTYALRSLYGHDMTLYNDPDTGKALLMVAYAYDGFKIVDVTRPTAPILQASWMPPPDSTHRHYTHSVAAERGDDGRLLIVVGSETFEEQNQGFGSPLWILDGTDAVTAAPNTAVPEHLGTWRNPGDIPAGRLGLSIHFFRVQDGLIYLSHYHGGVWGIDARSPEARADPQHFAYHLAVPDDAVQPPEDCCIGWDLGRIPMVFDVEVDAQGNVYAADLMQGLVVVAMEKPA